MDGPPDATDATDATAAPPPRRPRRPRRPHRPHRGLARLMIGAGLVTLAVAVVGLLLDVPPFPVWFYVFAWWGYIVAADGVVHLRTGSSLLLSRTRAFLLLLPWSVAFWLFFEAANFVLENWYYVGVPAGRIERLLGISVSFATVLPGVLVTADLLASFDFPRAHRGRELRPGPRLLSASLVLGVACLVLPLAFPEHAYPLVWGAAVFLIEPLLYRLGERGHLTALSRGEHFVPLRYLAAGAVCGLLWELWNYWSAAKWIYTVPFFEELKLFEMPVAGFLGFPPFALECYTFVRLLVALRLVPEVEAGVPSAPRRGDFELQVLGASAAFFASVVILPGVESSTVRSTAPRIADLIRDDVQRAALERAGCDDFEDLVEGLRSGELAEALRMTEHEREATLAEARLLRLAGMGRRGAAWLGSIGVYDVEALAEIDEASLLEAIAEEGRGPGPRPGPRELRVWMRRARAAPRG